MTNQIRQRVVASLVRQYDRRVMNNVHRGEYVECLVAEILGSGWKLPWTEGHDWAPWDLKHDVSGTRMEVRQSAALQSWHDGKSVSTSPRFDIAPRKGYWTVDGSWIDRPGRPADIYVFGWHPERHRSIADHRAPEQWRFFVVPTSRLPVAQKSIGLAALDRLVGAAGYESLASAVAAVVDGPQTEGWAPAHRTAQPPKGARRRMNAPNPEAQPLLITEGEGGSASCHGEVEFSIGSWSLHTHENPYRLTLCVTLEHSLQRRLDRMPWQAVIWTLKRGSDVFYVLGDLDDRYPGPHYSTSHPSLVENILVWLLSHHPISPMDAHGY